MFTDKIIELLKSIGLGSSAWTVNEPEDLQKLMKKEHEKYRPGILKQRWQFGRRWKGMKRMSPAKLFIIQ